MFSLEFYKEFKFNSSHFIAHDDFREYIHGHNYRVSIKFESFNHENGSLIDEKKLFSIVNSVCKKMHGKLILGKNNKDCIFEMKENDKTVVLVCKYDNSRFEFPATDCCFVNTDQASAECLSEYILESILTNFNLIGNKNIKYNSLCVEVFEDVKKSARTNYYFKEI